MFHPGPLEPEPDFEVFPSQLIRTKLSKLGNTSNRSTVGINSRIGLALSFKRVKMFLVEFLDLLCSRTRSVLIKSKGSLSYVLCIIPKVSF